MITPFPVRGGGLVISAKDPRAGRLDATNHATDLPTQVAQPEFQRLREETCFSYFVFGADFTDALAPVVAELAGRR